VRIIGTAGHVDHGKTALIRAMTGIDADRLPEEKARGMTTDLGFAWYRGGDGLDIGVVDVPGHERYLRNMVAGAWGLDLVVLVVAADDGWMPQTGLHAAIVASMAEAAVVIAVTKADAVAPGRAATVALEAEDRATALFGVRPPSVAVSSVSGDGITELKSAIDSRLASLPPLEPMAARLFVDRSFSPRGGGVVVTGSLSGGPVGVGDEVLRWPSGDRLRVRGIQSYRESVSSAEPNCRAALSVAAPKGGFARGDLLAAPGAAVLSGDEFIVRLLPLPGSGSLSAVDAKGKPALRPGVMVEFAVGSARRDAELWPIGGTGFARLTLSEPVACPLGTPFALLRLGGAELIGRGVAVRSGKTKVDDRKALLAALPRAAAAADAMTDAGWGIRGAVALALAIETLVRGWAAAPVGFPARAAEEAGLASAGPGGTTAPTGRTAPTGTTAPTGRTTLFDPGRLSAFGKAAAAKAGEPGGLQRAMAESLFASVFGAGKAAPGRAQAVEAAMASLEASGAVVRNGSAWSTPGAEKRLTPADSALLGRLEAAGKAGLEPGKDCPQTDARGLKALCSLGLAMPLDGGIFFSKAVYDACMVAILRGLGPGCRFSVPEAKARSGLSRKYILPLLNRMESQGLVKRSGDERVVLKTP